MPGLPRANTPSKIEVPKGEADMRGFKRNITSARAFLEAIRDSCNDDPTILNFFMALMVSWKAQRYVPLTYSLGTYCVFGMHADVALRLK